MRKCTLTILVALAFLVCASSAYGENRLLPTDVLYPGRFFAQTTYGYNSLGGDITNAAIEGSIDGIEQRLNFSLGIGISKNVDIVASSAYLAQGTVSWEVDTILGHVELENLEEGFEDTTVYLRFKFAEQNRNGVNAVFAVVGVLPSGERKDGQAGVEIDGIEVQDQKRGYPGNGVVSYGGAIALSGRSGNFEPYLRGSYIFGGRRTRHEIDEHYADVAELQVGIQWHTSPHAAFDFSLTGSRNSPEAREEDRDKTVSDSFLMGYANVSMYFEFAPNATFILGVSYGLMETHIVNRDDGTRLEGVSALIPTIGLHLYF